MKKILLSSLLAASVMFGANVCPDLSIKSKDDGFSKGVEMGLLSMPVISTVVTDLLGKYNNTTDPSLYFSDENMKSLGASVIFGDLLRLKYESDVYIPASEKKIKLDNEYERLLSLVNSENSNWCNETMSSDTKNFILAETNFRIKKAEADLKEMQTLHDTYNESVATIDLKKIEKCPGSTSIVILNETNKSEKDTLKSVEYNLDKKTNKLSKEAEYGKFTTNHQTTLDVCKNPNQTLTIKLKDARKDSIE